ncbi:MAG: DNA-3-methyladenine glycosylase [Nitriliruptor sp.]|nr:MAG: DNA-3-methyladenine glycosylase [Nitriliruptor sp.]
MHGEPTVLPRADLEPDAPVAARALVGALLVREVDGVEVIARVVETEAYREDDPASHSHARRTPRTEPMFAVPGTAYVYRSYGVHWLLNVSVEPRDNGAAVLLRAATVLTGAEAVWPRRSAARRHEDLLRGPAVLTAGLDVNGAQDDGRDLLAAGPRVWLARDRWQPAPADLIAGPRVGISQAADVAWRFHLAGAGSVSRYRRSPRAP